MRIRVRIDRVVLDGISLYPAERRLLRDDLTRYLEQRLRAADLPSPTARAEDRRAAPSIALPAGRPFDLGFAIADSVADALGRAARPPGAAPRHDPRRNRPGVRP
jgi:hypothetical protein